MPLRPIPYLIGRQAGNHLILRDNRASRSHAQIVVVDGEFWVEDLNSRHGVFVNGVQAHRHQLGDNDRIEFGVPDSYQLLFQRQESSLERLVRDFPAPGREKALPGGGNLSKLRAVLEVARALETSLSTDDVLSTVVDAALAVTGAERGFLLLRGGAGLDVRVARDRDGTPLAEDDLRVPTQVIHRALAQRRDLLSMNFDPAGESGALPSHTIADLELRSVVCVPLVKLRAGAVEETSVISAIDETVGLLYLDSRAGRADLASGNRELLTTLALEASTVLDNARLLEEQRAKQRMEEELRIARSIQQSLLPRSLPQTGWFQATGRSIPSSQVGGDYFDVEPLGPDMWSAAVVDVSGKGVSSALLASLLQGVFLSASGGREQIQQTMARLNTFLLERTGGGKYATMFLCSLNRGGLLRWMNAGHCPALLIEPGGSVSRLPATAPPVGLLELQEFPSEEQVITPGTRLMLYTDGVTEAQSPGREDFGERRLMNLANANASLPGPQLHAVIDRELQDFTKGSPQRDDITLLIIEYLPSA